MKEREIERERERKAAMVVALGPGKFYGSSLPRPRFYNKEDRVDPPVPVLDPLLSWANEAHWSMGGLSFKRLRLQGKIEGNIQKLRKEQEKRDHNQSSTPISELKAKKSSINGGNKGKKRENRDEDSPPPAPISKKRRQRTVLVDEESDDGSDGSEEERENEGVMRRRRRLVRKLGDDFEMVATENVKIPEGVARRTRSRRSMVLVEDEDESDGGGNSKVGKSGSERKGSVSPSNGARSSPRLKKKSS